MQRLIGIIGRALRRDTTTNAPAKSDDLPKSVALATNTNEESQVSDDILQDLKDLASIIDDVQGKACFKMTSGSILKEAATEIETLRLAIKPILDAYTKPGNFPGYHDYVKTGLKKEWPTMARAIENAIFLTAYGEWQEITKPEN